jgi:regulator of protease activity HflC (stomatin/prohibitin superfamily)
MKFKKILQLTSLRVFILDLQNVNITLRVLFRPVPTSLPNIYSTLGIDYDERVLPSITNEILKAVVVRLYTIFFFILSIINDF